MLINIYLFINLFIYLLIYLFFTLHYLGKPTHTTDEVRLEMSADILIIFQFF